MYHLAVRNGTKTERIRAGQNRREAERALRKVQVQVDDGTYRPQLNIPFDRWADIWIESLERKETTKASYRSTLTYAKEAFQSKPVRRLTPTDISTFNTLLRDQDVSASTRGKHLRVLGACLNAAVAHGYAGRNAVRELPRAERPRAQRKESAYFTNDELPALFAKLESGLFRTLFEVALKTGMRQGELLALTWGDVDLTVAIVRVRRSITDGHVGGPKNHERRDVDLTPDVVELLGAWWGECGRPTDDKLVFPGETPTGYLVSSTVLRRELYPALVRAEIPRVGPTGEKRTFHSLRHTYAKRALETGTQITWLSRHLGHSSLKVTTDIYGHWEQSERKKQAAMLAGAFGV
jgi:integrase